MSKKKYQDINAETIDRWIEKRWEWGIPVEHDIIENAKNGNWDVYLTPTKTVPKDWLEDLKGKRSDISAFITFTEYHLINQENMTQLIKEDCGIQFSHTIEEQIGGQLKAGFLLQDIYEDTNSSGNLYNHNIPCYIATKAKKSNFK